MHRNSGLLFERYARSYFKSRLRVLEIGPDGPPSHFARVVNDATIRWDTLDTSDRPGLTYIAAPLYRYPIGDNTYDLVLSGNVLEHVPRIWVWMRELARICKPGGHVITLNPVSWPYHEAPVDCWRAYPEGMRALYEDAGLSVLLSRWESLEAGEFPRTVPGRGLDWQSHEELETALRLLAEGGAMECAYDTVMIGRKVETD